MKKNILFNNIYFKIPVLIIITTLLLISSTKSDNIVLDINIQYEGSNNFIEDSDILLLFLMFHPKTIDYFLCTKYYNILIEFYNNNKEKIKYIYDEYLTFLKKEQVTDIKIDIENEIYFDPSEYYENTTDIYMKYLSQFINPINQNNDKDLKYLNFDKNISFITSSGKPMKFPKEGKEILSILNFFIYLKKYNKLNIITFKQLKERLISLEYTQNDIEFLKENIKMNLENYIRLFNIEPQDIFFKDNEIIGKGFKINIVFNILPFLNKYYISSMQDRMYLPLNKPDEENLYYYLGHEFSHLFTSLFDYKYTDEEKKKIKGEIIKDFFSGKILISKNSYHNNILRYNEYDIYNLQLTEEIKKGNLYYYNEILCDLAGQIFYYSIIGKLSDIRSNNILLYQYQQQFFNYYPEYLTKPQLFYKNLESTLNNIHKFTLWYFSIFLKNNLKKFYIYQKKY